MSGSQPLRWGILGAGIIANRLADAVKREAGSELIAVASKTPEKAQDFAGRHGIRAASDYDDLLADDTIDVVYVATTHNFHHDNARRVLDAGKHVLVEKPFTVNAAEAADLAARARASKRFAMEALWTRFVPTWQAIRERVASGGVGEVRQIDVTFGGIVPPHYEPRLTDPHLAGGVTLDMGVYPIHYLCHVLGERPRDVESLARFSDRGVDEIACYVFRFPSGCLATVSTSFRLWMPPRAWIHGTQGAIEHEPFQHGESFRVHHHDGTGQVRDVETVHTPHEENAFVYQVREVERRIAAGEIESAVVSLDETTAVMRVMDEMRDAWGLRYPFE